VRNNFAVATQALHLIVRTFVVVEPQPRHAVQDRADRFGRGALDVRIFDSEDELALVMARERPREQRGAGAAEMEEAGGAWCEAGADGGHLEHATNVVRIATCGTIDGAFYRRETGGSSARSRRKCRRAPSRRRWTGDLFRRRRRTSRGT